MSDMKRTPPHESCSSDSDSRGKCSSSGPKRRASRAGTRSVTTLTAAQLERKRANDREAQRAIRQRTKDHIEQLERRVAELSAIQDENTRLADALRRIEELKRENNSLRSKLSHALAALNAESGGAGNLLGSDGGMLSSGAPSPPDRIHITHHHHQPSPMSSVAPSLPPLPVHATPLPPCILSQPDHWTSHPGYSPALTSTSMEAPSTLSGDISSASEVMRWSAHSQRLGTPVSLPELSTHHHHPAEATVPSLSYNYMVDASGRPHYQQQQQPQQYQPHQQQQPHQQLGQHQVAYMPALNPGPQQPQYQGQHMTPLMPTSSAYAPYPTVQAYASPHPSEGAHMMHRTQVDAPHMMYQLPSNMKIEQ